MIGFDRLHPPGALAGARKTRVSSMRATCTLDLHRVEPPDPEPIHHPYTRTALALARGGPSPKRLSERPADDSDVIARHRATV